MGDRNLPVKIVLPRSEDIKKNLGNGSTKFFGELTNEKIEIIVERFEKCLEYYEDVFTEHKNVPAIGKIKVKKKAIAKSHKPGALCKECGIIGSGSLDEIYIKLTKEGINKTIQSIKKSPTKELKANLTAVESIEPISIDEKISKSILFMHSQGKFKYGQYKVKVKLFDFNNERDNRIIQNYVIEELEKKNTVRNMQFKSFGSSVKYFKLEVNSFEEIIDIAKINGVKSIDLMQSYASIKSKNKELKDAINLSDENAEESELIIGIIDSGISEKNSQLEKWIYEREVYVAEPYQNPYHGTFVASTIQYGNILNNIDGDKDKRFKFLDVVAIPNSDEEYGPIEEIDEDELMYIIKEVLEKYHTDVKIWNLSIGNPDKICDGNISDLAVFCDEMQDKYNVQFIICSGNTEEFLRKWPPQSDIGENDRIIAPSDSVRCITVGSIAYTDSNDSLVKKNQPSPFTRRGPGANFIVKPEVVDFGGNCRQDCTCSNLGMIGLDEDGNVIEDIGTSFSTPRVVYKFANILEKMESKDLLLSKAMLIHSARANSRQDLDIDDESIKYLGFGIPSEHSNDILMCSENDVTLIFKSKIGSGVHMEMIDFPYPESLIKDGKYTGEIYMTLAYDPQLDSNYGHEYCRSNIDISFGTYKYDKNGKLKYKGQVPLEKNWESRFESEQVEHGFKWSPIKSYYRNIVKGIEGDGWKLRIDKHSRYNTDITDQEFVLIVTIRDTSEEKQDIYSEVIRGLRDRGFITQDLQVRQKVRNTN